MPPAEILRIQPLGKPSRRAPRSGWHRILLAVSTWACLAAPVSQGRVVINEIMYHPPDDRDELQWVELHNTEAQPVSLEGWALTQGITFSFSRSHTLPAGGFLVVARDRGAFVIRYGTNLPVVGDFKGRLSHGGERLELVDAKKTVVDALEYSDAAPWPASPDGMSPSLERRIPAVSGMEPSNWAPSPLPPFQAAAGTPGLPNASATTNLPPSLRHLRYPSASPTRPQPTEIHAVVSDLDGIESVALRYRTLPFLAGPPAIAKNPTNAGIETVVPMDRANGDDKQGVYTATIPPQPEGHVIRFRIEATDRGGSRGTTPHPHDARPTWSILSSAPTNGAAIPFAFFAQYGASERPGSSLRNMDWRDGRPRRPSASGEPTRGDGTFVYIPPGSSEARVFDHVRLTPRQAGWKVRLHRDQLLDGMSTVNVLFEYQPRFVLSEHLAFETYRTTGVPTPLSGHWRAWYNGRPLGYHLFVEQPNSSFLRRVGRDTDGDLFKLIWYGGDLIGQHEKKNNPESGHVRLVETVEFLQKNQAKAPWNEIERRVDVPIFVDYFAVNMLIQNWDGFFNNYFLYRAPGADGKWQIIPWDEDKTWGDYDGASAQYDWYGMPLTYGMTGDQPRLKLSERFSGGMGPHGGPSWWRHPGWLSGPLLVHREFRSRFKTRLRDLLENQFTPEKMEPLIARMEQSLEPEVRYRAKTVRTGADEARNPGQRVGPEGDEAVALERFRRHIDSFRRQVRFRREFLLQELNRER